MISLCSAAAVLEMNLQIGRKKGTCKGKHFFCIAKHFDYPFGALAAQLTAALRVANFIPALNKYLNCLHIVVPDLGDCECRFIYLRGTKKIDRI